MLLTIVVVALLLLALIRLLLLLAMRDRARNWTRASTDHPTASEPFAVFCIRQAFDSDCAVIWDTQVPALELIDRTGIRGLPVRQLRPVYARSARSYPELYDGSTFGSWLEFLESEQLINRSNGHLFITAEGQQFLAYRLVPKEVLAG